MLLIEHVPYEGGRRLSRVMNKRDYILTVCFVLSGLLTGCASTSSDQADGQARLTAEQDSAPQANVKNTQTAEPAVTFPARKKSVYPEGEQTKRAWAKRLILEDRFPREMCGERSYLLECITAFRNPTTRVVGPFTRKECKSSVADIVSRELRAGRKKTKTPAGDFYANDLPRTLKAGMEMDLVAARLARRVLGVLIPKMRKFGAQIVDSPRCRALRAIASDIDGN